MTQNSLSSVPPRYSPSDFNSNKKNPVIHSPLPFSGSGPGERRTVEKGYNLLDYKASYPRGGALTEDGGGEACLVMQGRVPEALGTPVQLHQLRVLTLMLRAREEAGVQPWSATSLTLASTASSNPHDPSILQSPSPPSANLTPKGRLPIFFFFNALKSHWL